MKTEAELRVLAEDLARQARDAGCVAVIIGVIGEPTPTGAPFYCKWSAPNDGLVVTLADSMDGSLEPTKRKVRGDPPPPPAN